MLPQNKPDRIRILFDDHVSRQMLEFRMRITGVERQFSRGTRTVANR